MQLYVVLSNFNNSWSEWEGLYAFNLKETEPMRIYLNYSFAKEVQLYVVLSIFNNSWSEWEGLYAF